jgi:site-specific DNA recombinase
MNRSDSDNTAGQNLYGGSDDNRLAETGEQRYMWEAVSEEPNEMNPLAATMSAPFADAFAQTLTPKVAVSYLRVSTRDQAHKGGEAEGFSIPAQREANRHKAAALGAIVVKEFVDRGESAKTTNRPELQRMLEYVAENDVDYVIVHKVDRLARNREDDVEINRALGKAGVQLVSTTESIDETPSGMLLHGIMSSIAEFYSRNLANEVMKGMTQKARGGGTISKAPLGYRNVRTVDAEGREVRTVVIDQERAPLIKLAFELYATGQWTVAALADHLADRGLSTVKTPRVPSKPINEGKLNKFLVNPYYKGCVTFRGAIYPGKHEALIDELTWQQVQDILMTHASGERTRDHPHYLKSTVYCRTCGSRLLVQISKSKTGAYYPYFMCSGRHAKRTDCTQKAVLIEEVERRIEEHYEHIALDPEFRKRVEAMLVEELRSAKTGVEDELRDLGRERDKLERQRDKLMQAHYEGAIPLELLKREQDRIASGLLEITAKLEASNLHFDAIEANLHAALDLTENCGLAYKTAPDHIRRLFNQAFFKRILVGSDTSVETELAPPFDVLLGAQMQALSRGEARETYEDMNEPTQLSGLIANNHSNRRTGRRLAFPFVQGLSKRLLVPPREFESLLPP